MSTKFLKFLFDESGSPLIEYALIALLISTVIVGSSTFIGTKIATSLLPAANNLS